MAIEQIKVSVCPCMENKIRKIHTQLFTQFTLWDEKKGVSLFNDQLVECLHLKPSMHDLLILKKLQIWKGVDRKACGVVLGWVLNLMPIAHTPRPHRAITQSNCQENDMKEDLTATPALFPAELPYLSQVRTAGRW